MAEKDISIETVQIDLGSGEQFSDAYKKINPDCVVPTLQLDDGSCLSEVLAICSYLESQYPTPALLGDNDADRARILMWNQKIEQQGLLAVADVFRNSAKGFRHKAATGLVGYEQIPELAERGRGRVSQFFERLDGQLRDNQFVAGAHYSMADISALVVVDFSKWIKLQLPEELKNAHRWYELVSNRPGAVA